MDKKFRITDDLMPVRGYPTYSFKNGVRVVEIGDERAEIPTHWGYYQHLALAVLQRVLGDNFLNNDENVSVIRKLWKAHIEKNINPKQLGPYQTSYSDTYLLLLASDLELLLSAGKLPDDLVKRLRSANDGAMRGAIYEISIAAGAIRAGYAISWITAPSMPEFTATANDNTEIDFEAKRRDRSAQTDYDLKREIRAITKNLNNALKKKTTKKYLIFIDTDLPPASSSDYKEIYRGLGEALKQYNLKKKAIVITSFGYEYQPNEIDAGKLSTMVIQGENSPTVREIEKLITFIHAKLPPDRSSHGWPV